MMELPMPPLEEILGIAALKMEQTPQNPRWHGEGSVLAHTKLVCEELKKIPAFQNADEGTKQEILNWLESPEGLAQMVEAYEHLEEKAENLE